MATANSARETAGDRSGDGTTGGAALASRVVLLELVGASRPLTALELRDRTTLPAATVRAALVTLAAADLCAVDQSAGDRPPRYRLDGPSGPPTAGRP